MKKHYIFITLILILLSFFFWVYKINAQSFGGEAGGGQCFVWEVCGDSWVNRYQLKGLNFRLIGAWSTNLDLGEICLPSTATLTLQIDQNGTWVNVSSSTKIKLVSGSNPKTGVNLSSSDGDCFINFPTRRTSWVLRGDTEGQYSMRIRAASGSTDYLYFNIVIRNYPELAITTKTNNQYNTDIGLIYWFLGVKIITLAIRVIL